MMKAKSLKSNTKDSLANKYPDLIKASHKTGQKYSDALLKGLRKVTNKANGQ